MSDHVSEMAERIEEESRFVERLFNEIGKVLVGQRQMVESLLIGLLADGHILLEGVPGLAKTLAVKSLAAAIDADFQRIQFTPDLLPADILGTMVFNPGTGEFTPKKGPIFSHLILADEINRAPAKVQSALLEAMQERQVTIGDRTFQLESPFLVLATQNPIEQEGTYPLPEAQVDRFMLKIKVSYPSKKEELDIIDMTTRPNPVSVDKIIGRDNIDRLRRLVADIYVDEKIRDYIVNLVFATRNPADLGLTISVGPNPNAPEQEIPLERFIEYGASPRASIYLTQAAKAHAFIDHRPYVTPEDIKAIGWDVLRHRIILTYEAEAEQLTSDDIVQAVFSQVRVP